MSENKEFTLEELKQYDGQEGRAVYVAYKGKVYDVSGSKMWRGGKHMNRHTAAMDLTAEFQNAPHKSDVLDRYPQVGVLKDDQAAAASDSGPSMPAIVRKYPFLHRHPHPMTVHFPIVFSVFAPCFLMLYLIFGWQGFESASLCCLGASVFFTPVAIATGLFTWWLNYNSRIMKETLMKLVLPPILFIITLWAFIERVSTPGLMEKGFGEYWLYLFAVLLLFPLVGVIGWFGANLTFPIHKEDE